MKKAIQITPSTTVHALLDSYPELEELLIGMAPGFKRLKNPILRHTVAKIATLKQAAVVGGIELKEMISILRKTVGQDELDSNFSNVDYLQPKPVWFSSDKIVTSFDESILNDNDKMPVNIVLKEANNLKNEEIIELVTSFLPAPLIDIMKNKGFESWTNKENNEEFKSYFKKK